MYTGFLGKVCTYIHNAAGIRHPTTDKIFLFLSAPFFYILCFPIGILITATMCGVYHILVCLTKAYNFLTVMAGSLNLAHNIVFHVGNIWPI